MKQSTSRSLLSAAVLLPSIFAQVVPLMPDTGMDAMCVDDGLQTIIYEYPVFYSTVYESVGTIFSFLGGTNSLVINNPGQTIVTSTVLTTTVVSTSTTTATVTAYDGSGGIAITATLGAGIPSGTVTSIPAASPFALAFIFNAAEGNKPDGYAANGGIGVVTDADFFYLEGGELPSIAGGKVGRNSTQPIGRRQVMNETVAKIEASLYYNDITTVFLLVDGMLQWNSPDQGPATFYVCPDGLYAGFPDAPDGTCAQALVGAVAQVAINLEIETGGNTTSPTSTSSTSDVSITTSGFSSSSDSTPDSSTDQSSTSGDSSEFSSTTSDSDSGSDSSTATMTTDDGSTSTTSSDAAAATTNTGGDEGVCPGQDPSDDYFGYSVYCGQAVDPVDPDDELIPGGQTGVMSFDDCTILCDSTDGCTGLSYFAPGTTCYVHTGESQDPRDAPGYDGAIKNDPDDGGDDGGDSSSTTSTTSQDSSTTSGDEAMTTSDSGTTTSGSAESTDTTSTDTSSATSSSMDSDSSSSASSSAQSIDTSSAPSSSMMSNSATSMTGTDGMTTSASSTMSGMSSSASSTMSGTSSTMSGVTTSGSSTMSGMGSTTSSSTSSTTPSDICPTPTGTVVQGFSIYCGYTIDPVDNADDIPPVGDVTFQECINACAANPDCVGLSYIEGSTTCYMHSGQNAAPAVRDGWNGAAKVGAGGPSSTTTSTSPTTSTSSTAMASTSGGSASSGSTSSASSSSSSLSGTSSTTGSSSSGDSTTTTSGSGTTSETTSSSSSGTTTTTTGTTTTSEATTTTSGTTTTTSGETTTTSGTTTTTSGATTTTTSGTTTTSSGETTTTTGTTTTTTTTTSTTTSTSTSSTAPTPLALNNPPAGGPQDSNADAVAAAQCMTNCPTDASQIQHGYSIHYGERWGGVTITSIIATDFAACINACSASVDSTGAGNCVSVNFQTSGGTCYLHSDCHPTSSEAQDSGWDSAERVRSTCAVQGS